MSNNAGYHLGKTGERVNELLSRQFIVPTLSSAPTTTTLQWQDGKYIVDFRIGEMCRVKQGEEYIFYRLDDISNGVATWSNVRASELPDMSSYYTKEEVDTRIEEEISSITISEGESIKIVTEDEYNEMKESDTLSDNIMYFISKDGSPIALYIGKVQIAVREEGSKGFTYNFPIIF